MSIDFYKHAAKGNQFLNDVSRRLGDKPDTARASRVIRAFFRSIRNHITLEENFQLLSQLPLVLKGVYVDGWIPAKQYRKHGTEISFIEEMISENRASGDDFTSASGVLFSAKAVFGALQKYISPGELENIKGVLPAELKDLVPVVEENGREDGEENAEEIIMINITEEKDTEESR